MLRHKRIINFSLKSLKSSDVRSFHVTYSSFIRRVASSRKRYPEIDSSPEESAVAGNFIAQPRKSTCNNFYGIESDEGVILVKPTTLKSPHNSFINTLASKKLPENFKKTSFGKVRLDNENKLTLHGQFEESTSLSDVEETIRAIRLRNFAIEDSGTNASPPIEDKQVYRNESHNLGLRHFAGAINQRESEVKRSESDVAETQNDISLVDELYFPDKMLQNEESDSITHANPSVNEKSVSYIDENYFSDKSIEENIDQATSFANENGSYGKYNDGSLHKKSALIEEKLGYIDQSFFGATHKDMNTKKNVKFTFEGDLDSELESHSKTEILSSTTKKGNMSFIDECFFDEGLESKSVGKNTKQSIENLGYREISIYPDNIKENKNHQIYNENEPVYKSSTEINIKNMECNKDKNRNYNRETLTMNTIEEENLYYNSPDLNHQDDTFTKGVSSFKNSNFTYKEAMKESLNSGINPKTVLSDIDLNKRYLNDEKLNQTNLVINKISENEKEKNRIQEDDPETAFDFVKKFRGAQKVTYHEIISGFSNAQKEKLDSKGLRILKYQVPQLKYFTRDEMLELLAKNVLYSDDDVVVLNKPYNLVMHDSKTTKDACLSKYLDDFAGLLDKTNKNPKLLTVHRLDKETTGCLLLARNEVSAQKLKSLFAQRKIVKTYWIVTIRVPDPFQGIIDIPIAEGVIDKKARMVLHPDLPKDVDYKNHSKRGKNAVTHYNVISESGNAALVEVKPETGIKHQIRVHFGLGLACPILGDNKYSYPDKFVPQKLSNDMLHRLQVQQSKVRHIPMHIYARSIFIPQYTTGRNLFVMAPMPIHMSKNLQRLKFKK